MVFILERDQNGLPTVRVPDIAYVRAVNIPEDTNWQAPFPQPPDPAVEVISSEDTASAILTKTRNYLNAGSAQRSTVLSTTWSLRVH